jgi:putative transposase
MSRLPRIIVPDIPHHATQRGNRRQQVFFGEDDYALYKDWLAQACRENGVDVWSYCLMPNHVHLILVPSDDSGLSRAVGETHRRYSGYINARLRVTGHLFQGRFGSVAMDESHLMAAFRYVALNPVKANLAPTAAEWQWSSTPAHLCGQNDGLVNVAPLLARLDNVTEFLAAEPDSALEPALTKSNYGDTLLFTPFPPQPTILRCHGFRESSFRTFRIMSRSAEIDANRCSLARRITPSTRIGLHRPVVRTGLMSGLTA